MTTQTTVSETMTVQATVAEASQEAGRNGVIQWSLRLISKEISPREYPFPCFLAVDRAPSILKGSVHLVTLRRGKLKPNMDGKFPNHYQWDLTGWDVQAQVPTRAPSQSPKERTDGAPVPWDAADTQSHIAWGQAMNLALQTLSFYQEEPGIEVNPIFLAHVEAWANGFYPLIRKGPTWQEEPVVAPAQETPQEPQNDVVAPGAAPTHKSAPRKRFPVRGEKETAFVYMTRVAQEMYGKNRDQMLKAIGGNWPSWEAQHGTPEKAIQAAILRLAEE